ncbi:hypothetical protein [Spongorhabdus nitratireducens]
MSVTAEPVTSIVAREFWLEGDQVTPCCCLFIIYENGCCEKIYYDDERCIWATEYLAERPDLNNPGGNSILAATVVAITPIQNISQ